MPKMSFQEWVRALDREVARVTGMSVHDFADFCMRDAYDDGVSPKGALRLLARADDDFAEMLALARARRR